jgi:hypothetical protein
MPARDMRGGSRRFPNPAHPDSVRMEIKTIKAEVFGLKHFIKIHYQTHNE